MRILYFINQISNSGGIERIVIDKVNFLADRNHDVGLVYYGSHTDIPFYNIDSRVCRMCISKDASTHSFVNKILAVKQIYAQMNKYIKSFNPEIIVNANVVVISYMLPFVFRNIPKIVELHFSYDGLQIMNRSMYGNNKLKIKFQNWLRKTFYPMYDKCIVLTKDDVKSWGFKNIDVIENFSNLKTIEGNRTFGFKKAINVGRLEFQKDHESLIRAWKIVHEKHPEWELEIWGNGSLKEKLEKLITHLNLQGTIKLCGVTNNIKERYLGSDFFILSSRYEGQPLVMIEAMQCGLPCVSYFITGTHDVIENQTNGFLVEQHTVESLAGGICKMIDRKDYLPKMSESAIVTTRRFEKDIIMQKWEELFTRLVKVQ